MAAPCSQWIACSPVRKWHRGGPLNKIVRHLVNRHRPFTILWFAVLFVVIYVAAIQWLATDVCLDRGGYITGLVCANDSGAVETMFSLVGARAAVFLALGIGALVTVMWCATIKIKKRRDV